MKSIVCVISGRGSNLAALLAAQRARDWERRLGARVSAVIANVPSAAGLEIAHAHGIATQVVAHAAYAERAAFDAVLAAAIDRHGPALVVLAGFRRVLTPAFVQRYAARLINVHPSLLPAFPGLETHQRALQAGVRVHGATVHFVQAELDSGPIIAQAALAVAPGESAGELAARVLALEHVLLPRCVEWILEGRVRIEGGRTSVAGASAGDLLLRAP